MQIHPLLGEDGARRAGAGRDARARLVGVVTAILLAACSAPSGSGALRQERSADATAPSISQDFELVPPVLAANPNQAFAAVVPGPGAYLVLDAVTRTSGIADLVATRVLPDRSSTDPQGVLVARDPGNVYGVWTGDHWLVGYQGAVTVVLADGTVGATTALPFGSAYLAGMAFSSDRALVVTRLGEGVFVDASGAPLGSSFTIVPRSTNGETTSVALIGSSYAVASVNAYNPGVARVWSVTNSGPTGKYGDAYNVASSRVWVTNVAVSGGGVYGSVSYSSSPPACQLGGSCLPLVSHVRTVLLSAEGDVTLGAEQPPSTQEPLPSAIGDAFFAVTGSRAYAVASAVDGSGYLAYSASLVLRVSAAQSALDAAPYSPLNFAVPQRDPVAAFDGSAYLVGLQDLGRVGVYGAHVSTQGSVLPPVPIAIGSGTPESTFSATNGQGALVGWVKSGVQGALVADDATLVPLDFTPLAEPSPGAVVAASNGDDYALLFERLSGARNFAIVAVSKLGAVSAPFDFGYAFERKALAFDGENYVLVWLVTDGAQHEIFGVRLTPDLGVVDTTPKPLVAFPSDQLDVSLALASDGAHLLVMWNQGQDQTLRAARLDHELGVLDPNGLVITSIDMPVAVAAAWDAGLAWLTWGTTALGQLKTEFLARRLGADGNFVDAAPFALATDAARDISGTRVVSLAPSTSGGLLLAYVQDSDVTRGSVVRGKLLGSPGVNVGGASGFGGLAGGGGSPTESGGASQGGATAGTGAGGTNEGGAESGGTNEGGAESGGTSAGAGTSAGGTESGGTNAGGRGGAPTAGHGGIKAGGRGGAPTAGSGHSGASGKAGSPNTAGSSGAELGGAAGAEQEGGAGEATAGAPGENPPPASGCGCAVPRHTSNEASVLANLGVLLALLRRRRERSTRRGKL